MNYINNCHMILTCLDASRDHNKWLEVRNGGLGGSDAGVILGLNKYKSPYKLWLEKTGNEEPEDISNKPAVMAGVALEPVVAKMFENETGKKVRKLGTVASNKLPFMHANIDRQVERENAGLEIKTGGSWSKRYWEEDEVPDTYYAQCLHYMAVTGAKKWYIAAWLGGENFIWKEIPRNEEDIKMLVDRETDFWNHVKSKTPPDIDASISCGQALAERYKEETAGSEIDLPDAAGALFMDYDRVKEEMKKLKETEQGIKNQFMDLLKENEVGRYDTRKVTFKAPKAGETVRLSEIKKNCPEIYEELKKNGLVHERAADRRLRIY